MTERQYELRFSLSNYKSYFGEPTQFSLRKPLTVLAGPNGEGKSNLVEGLLIPTAEFLNATQKFARRSLFHRDVLISPDPPVTISYYDLIFQNHILRSLHRAKSEIGPPRRLDPASAISEGELQSNLVFTAVRAKAGRERTMAKFSVDFIKGQRHTSGVQENELDDFDLLYVNSDSVLVDFLVHLLSDEIARRWEDIPGAGQKADFVADVLNYFPDETERLIQDVSNEGFLERFLGDTYRFLRENLATGAKKETLIYLIGLVLERFHTGKDNLLLVLLDEFESGINVMRQKLMVNALAHILEQFSEKRNYVKIVLTTHSPVIFSELERRRELADVYYVLRHDHRPSHVYAAFGGETDEEAEEQKTPREVEKKILLELGLNVFDLPRRVVFVEGKSDSWFLGEVFGDCHLTPLNGGNLPEILRQLLGSLRLAWEKRYTVLVDANKVKSIEADVARVRERHGDDVNIEVMTHGSDSLEEFLLDIDLSGPVNAVTLWKRIEVALNSIDERLVAMGEEPLGYDITEIREDMEDRGKEGVEIFLHSLKRNERLYRAVGKYWRSMLTEAGREFIRDLQRSHQLSYRDLA